MSAAPILLPKVWATAARFDQAVNAMERKGPQRLVLVRAQAAPGLVQSTPLAATLEHGNYAFYRKYTEAVLRRAMKMSLDGGRVPSFLGREIFRGEVTNYKVKGFDDSVIFVVDVERCVAKLETGQQYLVRRVGMQEYTLEETAAMTGVSLRTIVRRYNEALDELTRTLLERKVMEPTMACPEGADR